MYRPNTLHHNTAANFIRTPYTAFYIGGSINILPNNKSQQNALKTLLRVKHKNNRPGIAPGQRSFIQFQYFNQDLHRQQKQQKNNIHAFTAFQPTHTQTKAGLYFRPLYGFTVILQKQFATPCAHVS